MKPLVSCCCILIVVVSCIFGAGELRAADAPIRLLVRADDIGSSHAANVACIRSYREGIVRSVEIMVPCPWFNEAVAMLDENPGLDVGVHLDLTAEWELCKWGPITKSPSLCDEQGNFFPMTSQRKDFPPNTGFLDAKPKLEEVEQELRAQIELALKKIDNVTHLSCHMGTATATPELRALVERLSREYQLPLGAGGAKRAGGFGGSHTTAEEKEAAMVKMLEDLKPGLWIFVEHPGLDTPEMRAIGHDGYRHVAADRDGVTRAFTSKKVQAVVKRRGIQLVSYGDVNREPFDVDETGDPAGKSPLVQPWRHIPLDPEYGGAWVVAGDLDGDGSVEIVSARNVDQSDVHYTSAVVAQRLDGSVLWRWGDPKIGRKKLHHDVACQIHDWDNDGRNEVVLCAKDHIVVLDGATGKEKHRMNLPKDASDCLVFARLSDKTWASDVLVKTRYGQIWAFDRNGKELWTVKNPGGFRTAHQPVPIDLDGDGIDEIMAGYAMLNADGTVRWVFKSEKIDNARGHVDCCRVLRPAKRAEDVRLVLTCCGGNNLAVIDGHGKPVWEVAGHHYESVDVGRIRRDVPGVQIAVDIDHRPWGQGPICLFDADGRQLGQIMTDYARHHALVDWTGDGLQEILVAQGRGLFDGFGRRIATLAMPDPKSDESAEMLGIVGDMTGDGVPDVLLTTRSCSDVYIYKNERGKRPLGQVPLGTETNFTLY